MFWQSLQVTFEIFCSHVEQVGTSFSGSNVPNKWTFWIYIDGRTICDVYGTYWSGNKRSLSKVMHVLYFISAFCVVPAMLASLFTAGADGAGYQIIALCFRQKAFLKSDMLAGFTTSVALIEYLTCVM